MTVIGVDIGGTKIDVGVVLDQQLKKLISEPTKAQASQEEFISQLTNLIDQVFNPDVKAIGIGAPGIIDVEKGIVFEVTNIPSLKRAPLKEILEKKYNVSVFVNNDANCFALGEKYSGQGKGYQNMALVIVGTGLGAGLILNGKLYCGHNCGAGEFGEIVFKDHNFEHYCSGQFFSKEHGVKGSELFEQAKQNNPEALRIFDEFGKNLGKALAMVAHSLDPELIVLGGSVTKSYDFFKHSMIESLKESVYERTFSRLTVKVSDTPNIAVLGAASLYYNSKEVLK